MTVAMGTVVGTAAEVTRTEDVEAGMMMAEDDDCPGMAREEGVDGSVDD